MNEFFELVKSDSNTFTFVLIGGAVFFIKSLFEVLSTSVIKEITFKQEQRHKIESVKTEIEIEEEKCKLEIRKSMLNSKGEASLAKEISKVIEILEKICYFFHAYRVTIAIYHNGVHKNFGNYSIRYDESRPGVPKVMNDYQSKPLSSFIKEIQRFELEDVVVYTEEEKMTSSNTDVILYMRQNKIKYKYVVPLLIKYSDDLFLDNRQWKINKRNEDYYIIGTLMMDLDEDILYDDKEIKISLINRANEIIEIYKNNHKIFV